MARLAATASQRASASSRGGVRRKPDTADALYQQYLAKLNLPRRVSAIWARERAERRLKPAVLSTYFLWALGEDPRNIGMHPRTVARHRSAIKMALKINIRTPASATLGNRTAINAARVFRWANRVVPDAVDINGMWDLAQAPC